MFSSKASARLLVSCMVSCSIAAYSWRICIQMAPQISNRTPSITTHSAVRRESPQRQWPKSAAMDLTLALPNAVAARRGRTAPTSRDRTASPGRSGSRPCGAWPPRLRFRSPRRPPTDQARAPAKSWRGRSSRPHRRFRMRPRRSGRSLSSVNGSRRRVSSDEYPVPKSSIERPMPLMRRRVSTSAASSGLVMTVVSVISAISATVVPGHIAAGVTRSLRAEPGSPAPTVRC